VKLWYDSPRITKVILGGCQRLLYPAKVINRISGICFLLLFAGVGSVHRTGPTQETRPSGRSRTIPSPEDVYAKPYAQAYALMQNRKYLEAEELFQFVYDGDRKNRDLWHAARTLTGIGACQYGLFRYQESLHAWLEARQMSESVTWIRRENAVFKTEGPSAC
jgi:hypothetical protein